MGALRICKFDVTINDYNYYVSAAVNWAVPSRNDGADAVATKCGTELVLNRESPTVSVFNFLAEFY